MEKNAFFKFEDEHSDFPLYNNNPPIRLFKWAVLVLAIIITASLILIPLPIGRVKGLLYFMIPFLAFGYATNWNFGLICKKIRRKDIALVLILFLLELIFSSIAAFILKDLGFVVHSNPVIGELTSVLTWIIIPFQLFGEELIKIIPFLILAAVFYHFTKNRKVAVIGATVLSLALFGILHLPAYGNLVSVLVLQGAGSVFTMFAYLKTKNIFVSYLIHLLLDTTIFLTVLLPVFLSSISF